MLRFITVLVSAFITYAIRICRRSPDRKSVSMSLVIVVRERGQWVWMMRIGPKAENEAIVQVSHVDNDIDGQIFRCKVKALQDGEKSYTAVIKGKSFELLRLKEGKWQPAYPG